jgi:hypothetical protein
MVQQAKQIPRSLGQEAKCNQPACFSEIMLCYATPKYAIVEEGFVEYRRRKMYSRDRS